MPLRISLAHQFEQQQDETSAAHFSLDGTRLVSSDGQALYLWRLTEDEHWTYERSLPFRNATFPRFAPNEQMLAFGGKEAFIHLISVEGSELATFPVCSHASWAFSPDQRWLISSGTQRDILLWDLTTYQRISIPIPFPAFDRSGTATDLSDEPIGGLQCTPDGQRLVFGVSSADGYVHVCHVDPVHRRIMRQNTLPIAGILADTITPNGKLLAILDVKRGVPSGTELFVYDLEAFQLLEKCFQTIERRYSLLAFSPDRRFLACSTVDGTVDIWSTSSFQYVTSFAAHPGLTSQWSDPIGGLDWSKTGYIVTGGASVLEKDMKTPDYSIKLWKVEAD